MSYIEDYVRGRAMSKNQKFAQQVFDKRRAEAMAPQAENIYGKPGYTHRGTPLRPGMTAPQMGTGVYNFNEKPEERYLKMQQRMLGTMQSVLVKTHYKEISQWPYRQGQRH